MDSFLPTYSNVVKAHELIEPYVHRTPILSSKSIDEMTGGHLFFKCENFQRGGAFKFRGATTAVRSLPRELLRFGVATHSSGNHAAALSLAAKTEGIKAFVVMPRNAPESKKRAVASYGGEITFCEPTLAARERTLTEVIAETGAAEIHPYDNFHVIAGQGTAAKELLEEHADLHFVLAPVGGGGLLAGTGLSVKQFTPAAQVIGCEPAGADDAARSYQQGKIIPSQSPQTIADGLLTSLGTRNFAIIIDTVDNIVTVSEKAIVGAMKVIWERMKIIIEPSSAVPLAALLEKKIEVRNKRVGIILSGGNVDLDRLPF